MDLKIAKESVENWLENFIEVPHPALGGFPPCPYARQARLKNQVDYRLGGDPYLDLLLLSKKGMESWEVVVYIYDPKLWGADEFNEHIDEANAGPMKTAGLVSLSDHPDHPESQKGVCFNHGTYALSICALTKNLDDASVQLHKKGYYEGWDSDYLDDLFTNRQDPRKQ
jgi:hypothetical protein